MSGLFSKPKLPPAPKPVRMPTEMDPDVRAAGQRAREGALRRSGRLSTIMTDQLGARAGAGPPNPEKASSGSSGIKLGA